jgi:hypothetical protein
MDNDRNGFFSQNGHGIIVYAQIEPCSSVQFGDVMKNIDNIIRSILEQYPPSKPVGDGTDLCVRFRASDMELSIERKRSHNTPGDVIDNDPAT